MHSVAYEGICRFLGWISYLVRDLRALECHYIHLQIRKEMEFSDYTLYFLAFNHSGRELTDEEKNKTHFSREGMIHCYSSRPQIPGSMI